MAPLCKVYFLLLPFLVMGSTFGEDVNTTSAKPVEEVGTFFGLVGHFFMGQVIDTKWCGPGNIARSIYDLGGNSLVDSCCRDHDLCKHSIAPGGTLHGLTNNRFFTAVTCECDEDFRSCLESINSVTSNAVIVAYSASLPQCFSLKFTVFCAFHVLTRTTKRCTRYVEWRLGKAVDNEDKNDNVQDNEKYYQWMDSPFFSVEEPQFIPGTIEHPTTAIPLTTTTTSTTAISERGGGNYKQIASQKTDPLTDIKQTETDINLEVRNTLDLPDQVQKPQPSHFPVWVPQTENFKKQATNNGNHLNQAFQQHQYQPSPWFQWVPCCYP